MEKKKKDRLPLLTCLCLVPIVAALVLAFLNENVTDGYYQMESILIRILPGFVILGVCQFLDERHFYKPAPILYASLAGILGYQLIIGEPDAYPGMSVIELPEYMYLYTPNLLFLAYFFIAWYISRQQKFGTREYALLTFFMGLPAVLIFLQAQEGPAVLMFAVYIVTVHFLKKEKRINVPWIVLALPVILVLISAVAFGLLTDYGRSLTEVVLTRGQCDPYGTGFQRAFIDNVLKSTPAIGQTGLTGISEIVNEYYSLWSCRKIVMFLAGYGWLPASIVVALSVVIHVLIFRMVSKIRQSLFARYLSLLLSTFLLFQTVLSLIGTAFLSTNFYDLPFFSISVYLIAFNYMSLGIIIMLYRRRNDESVVSRIEAKKCETERVSIIARARDFVDMDDEKPDEFSEEPRFLDKVRAILLGEEEKDEFDKELYEDLDRLFSEKEKEALEEKIRNAEKNETFAELPSDTTEE